MSALTGIFALLVCAAPQDRPLGRGHWPQWRGPARDNIAQETGLLRKWPEAGPPLLREIRGIGTGIPAVVIDGGRVFTIGYLGDSEYVTALDEVTGKGLWTARLGPSVAESSLMRWLGQRAPTVDGDRLYACHSDGLLLCLETQSGKELWRKDYKTEFGTVRPGWGICDRPLVDGGRLICTPGGRDAGLAALDKVSGAVLWKSPSLGAPAYAATVISEAAGVRQYVTCLLGKIVGIRAADGKLLWTRENFGATANTGTPMVLGDAIVAASGYRAVLLNLKLEPREDGSLQAVEQYARRLDVSPFQDSTILFEGHLYAFLVPKGWSCLDARTGQDAWGPVAAPSRGLPSMTYADGMLITLQAEGHLSLVEVSPTQGSLVSTFRVPEWQSGTGASNPVVAAGRLYIRNESRLLCYDLRGTASREERPRPETIVLAPPAGSISPAPTLNAVFVATPQDVVDKMLETAAVGKDDVVYDLGSGDGRIVISAAKKHGAKAVGYEIDPTLVTLSKERLEKAGVAGLATIELKDMHSVDLAPASVIAVYLPGNFLEGLRPQFEKLKPGSRIISHQFKIPGCEPDKTVQIESKDDGNVHAIHLWITPLSKERK